MKALLAALLLMAAPVVSNAQEQRVDFASLPFGHAIRVVHGDGARRIAVFEDPYCPFCRKLEGELSVIDNVTIFVFLFPILTPQSAPMSNAIWCAPDRAQAWRAWMSEHRAPASINACANTPIADNLALAKRLGVRITPTIVFADGALVTGALPLNDLEAILDGAHP